MKRTAPLALRNQALLLEVLREVLPRAPGGARRLVLEVGSGTGEHAVAFARALPWLDWQPSDPDPEARASIAAWSAEARLPNLLPPLDLDLAAPAWRRQAPSALLCVNVLHVAPHGIATALLDGAAEVLPPGAPLVVYGPFRREGLRLPRLVRFHGELAAFDPRLGIPALAPFLEAAAARGLLHEAEWMGVEEGDVLLVLRRASPRVPRPRVVVTRLRPGRAASIEE